MKNLSRSTYAYRLSAFTLIELSISLLIIGLLVSSVVVGNRLYKAASLRKIIQEQEIYKTAINNFKDTFNAVPGDMINALSVLPRTVAGIDLAGNGNGNGLVDTAVEIFLMPQHLQAAAFLNNDNYDGTSKLIFSQITPNAWIYKSFNQRIFNIWRANEVNLLYYNKNTASSNGSISASEASEIDFKIDDGNATTGYVYAFVSSTAVKCIATTNGTGSSVIDSTYSGTDANYILSSSAIDCELLFGF